MKGLPPAGTHRVFGVGLPKTGTQSLNAALNRLGYVSKHNDKEDWKDLSRGKYRWDKRYWATTHFGCRHYAYLHDVYPEARFILTVREDWLESARHWFSTHLTGEDEQKLVRWLIFGMTGFNEAHFREVYRNHVENFVRWAVENKVDYLMFNVKEGWGPLCRFLDVPEPKEPFPHRNARHPTT